MDKFYTIIPAKNGDPSEICEHRQESKRLENCEPYEGQSILFPENVFKIEVKEEIAVKPSTASTKLGTGWQSNGDGSFAGATCTMLHSSLNLSRKIKDGEQFSVLQASPPTAIYHEEEGSLPAGAISTLTVRSDSTRTSYKIECTYFTKKLNGLEALFEQLNNSYQHGSSKIVGIINM